MTDRVRNAIRSFKRKLEPKPVFTGSCPVRQHTADGNYVGRCYHSTYNYICHLHGDVSRFLRPVAPDLTDADDRLIDETYDTRRREWLERQSQSRD